MRGWTGQAATAGDQNDPAVAVSRPSQPGFEKGGRGQNASVEATPATKRPRPGGRRQEMCTKWIEATTDMMRPGAGRRRQGKSPNPNIRVLCAKWELPLGERALPLGSSAKPQPSSSSAQHLVSLRLKLLRLKQEGSNFLKRALLRCRLLRRRLCRQMPQM